MFLQFIFKYLRDCLGFERHFQCRGLRKSNSVEMHSLSPEIWSFSSEKYVYPFFHPPIHSLTHLLNHACMNPLIHSFIHPSTQVSIYLPIHLPSGQSIHPFLDASFFHPSPHLPSVYLPNHLFIHSFIHSFSKYFPCHLSVVFFLNIIYSNMLDVHPFLYLLLYNIYVLDKYFSVIHISICLHFLGLTRDSHLQLCMPGLLLFQWLQMYLAYHHFSLLVMNT